MTFLTTSLLLTLTVSVTSAMLAIDEFKFGPALGQGSQGWVQVAQHTYTGNIVVIKSYPRRMGNIPTSATTLNSIITELFILTTIDHKNVWSMYGYFYDEDRVYVVGELATLGDLFDYAEKLRQDFGYVDELTAAYWFQQLIRGVQQIHKLGYIHRDLKHENILVTCTKDNELVIKIADFGLSCINAEPGGAGTMAYISPQVCKQRLQSERFQNLKERYFPASRFPEIEPRAYMIYEDDTWAMGLILYEWLSGKMATLPRDGLWDPDAIAKRVSNFDEYKSNERYTRYGSFSHLYKAFSKNVRRFVNRLLVASEAERLSDMEAMLTDPWMRKSLKRYQKEQRRAGGDPQCIGGGVLSDFYERRDRERGDKQELTADLEPEIENSALERFTGYVTRGLRRGFDQVRLVVGTVFNALNQGIRQNNPTNVGYGNKVRETVELQDIKNKD